MFHFSSCTALIYVVNLANYCQFEHENNNKKIFQFLLVMKRWKNENKLFVPRRLALYICSFSEFKRTNKLMKSVDEFGSVVSNPSFKGVKNIFFNIIFTFFLFYFFKITKNY